MKILWVCPFFPYPPDTGIRLREYNLITILSRCHQITLFSLIDSAAELDYLDEMRASCASVIAMPPTSERRRDARDALLGIVDKRPLRFYGRKSGEVMALLRRLLEQEAFDVLLVETLFMSTYVWDLLPCKNTTTILVEHNVETFVQKQILQTVTSMPKRLRKWIYYKSFIEFERRACQLFDTVVTVSELERRYLLDLAPRVNSERVVVVPNGVHLAHGLVAASGVEADSLIYSGALTYEANLDAMEYFLTAIMPLIWAQRPGVKLRITGKTDGVDLSRLPSDERVIFTGYLEDVRPAIAQSWACVVPLRWGGGTRLKVLEALASGTPVVSTSKGAEGLDLRAGQDLLVADEPPDFAAAVLRLLQDPDLRETLRRNGRRAVETKYDWQIIGRRFSDFVERAAAGRGRGPSGR